MTSVAAAYSTKATHARAFARITREISIKLRRPTSNIVVDYREKGYVDILFSLSRLRYFAFVFVYLSFFIFFFYFFLFSLPSMPGFFRYKRRQLERSYNIWIETSWIRFDLKKWYLISIVRNNFFRWLLVSRSSYKWKRTECKRINYTLHRKRLSRHFEIFGKYSRKKETRERKRKRQIRKGKRRR